MIMRLAHVGGHGMVATNNPKGGAETLRKGMPDAKVACIGDSHSQLHCTIARSDGATERVTLVHVGDYLGPPGRPLRRQELHRAIGG
jgi:hypothetical protein